MSSNINNIDEFGRDLSLKPKNYKPINLGFLERYKGMSWAEIGWLIDEEEEAEQAKKNAEKKLLEREELRQALAQRKKLHQQGLYELEEGEELDI